MVDNAREQALKLKEEGNAYFARKMYNEATDKYTAAIKVDEKNAVLWANRAACRLNLRRPLDAADDADQAVQLDPLYGKGWSRLAQARQDLGKLEDAIEAWQRALACLPTDNPSQADQKQRSLYHDSLQEARRRLQDLKTRTSGQSSFGHTLNQARMQGKWSWDRAEAMLPQLCAQGGESLKSSAFVICAAHSDFKEFLESMDKVRAFPGPGGAQLMSGPLNLIDLLANVIIADTRAFYISDREFIKKYNRQVFESTQYRAWVTQGPEVVFELAQQRLAKEGWNSVRPAMSVTVRGWVVQGFMTANMQQDHGAAIAHYQNAINFLERGRRTWPDVDKLYKGTMFERTFIRGVRQLLLEAHMVAHKAHPQGATKYPAQKLLEMAVEQLEDVASDPQPAYGGNFPPGYISSFWVYPAAQAHSIKGFCYNQMARAKARGGNADNDTTALFLNAANSYLTASETYPADDECHALHLSTALSCYARAGAKLSVCLPLMARLRTSAAQMREIWETSQLALGGRDVMFRKVHEFEDQLRRQISDGKLTEEDVYRLPFDM